MSTLLLRVAEPLVHRVAVGGTYMWAPIGE